MAVLPRIYGTGRWGRIAALPIEAQVEGAYNVLPEGIYQ
jgi:hypothetical protein